MKHFFHLLFLALFSTAGVLLSSCKDDGDTPAPTTGALKGQITPANAVTTVTVTSTATPATTATATPTNTGAYSFASLAAGTYTLSFTPATGFAAPAPQTVTVSAGGNTTATPVTATAASTSGSATLTVGSTSAAVSLVTANYILNNLSVTMASTGAITRSVVFNIDGFNNAAGTFTLTNPGNSTQLIYSEQIGTSAQQWTTASFLGGGQGTGTITITAVGTNPRRVSGSFTATAFPATSTTTGNKVVAGTFTNLAY